MLMTAFGLILFFWIGLHTSQSFIDLADFILIIAAFWTAIKAGEIRMMGKSFKPAVLWPFWLSVVILGFVFGAPTEVQTALKLVWEFRWFISFVCYVYLFKKLQWDEAQLRKITVVLLFFSIMDLVLFFVDYDKDPRAGGLFGHSMPFAHSMGPAALFLLFLGIKKAFEKGQKTIWRVIYFAAPILASIMVVLSFTRGIWIGYTLALLFCSAFLGRKVFISSFIVLAIIGGGLFLGSQRIQSRVMGKTNAESQSNNERLFYWKANLEMFRDYPAFGIGYSQNNVHVEGYLKKSGVEWLTGSAHAHNQYIHFLSGTGFLGLSCFLVFLVFLFYPIGKMLVKMKRQENLSNHYYLLTGIFAAMLCFVVGGLTESNFSIAKNRFMFLFIAAIGYAISTQTSTQIAEKNK